MLEIPERDWRLLGALAKKRDLESEQDRLAEEFHRLWQTEKEERQKIEKQTSYQYRRYISAKREEERRWTERRRLEQALEEQVRTGQLVSHIRHKERRSAGVLAEQDDKKIADLIEKATELDARAALAAERRTRLEAAEQHRRDLELDAIRRRMDEARRRKMQMMRDASERLALTNALNTWEATILRQQTLAMEASTQAHHAARAAITDARTTNVLRAKERKKRRARKVASVTRMLRDAVKAGYY
ncbi:differentially expressed in FDCP 6 homolog [Plutella xylostella]|uniref:differentially expressed in FDCP 6 homolog n=1 Tax=Plutella xylostella TaxID=51655 RepID=UPI0020327281|nr:differentially expressed in FDCP 6 homolog [Plutella xylostella]